MLNPLIIDNNIRGQIKKVVDYAFEHRIGQEEMAARANDKTGQFKPVGDDMNRTLGIPTRYTVTFSIEQHGPSIGWAKHISIGIDLKEVGKPLPSLHAVHMLMLEFGMQSLKQDRDVVWIETIQGGEMDGKQVINILQKFSPPGLKKD